MLFGNDNNGLAGIWTRGLRHAKATLYHLSYQPNIWTLTLCYLKLLNFSNIPKIKRGSKITDLNIRNVVNDDFNRIAGLAENCGPMSTMPNAVTIYSPNILRKLPLWLRTKPDHKNFRFFTWFYFSRKSRRKLHPSFVFSSWFEG